MEKTDAQGRYTVVCRYCGTRVCGTASRGIFATVTDAAKALAAHLRYSCERAPKIPSRWRERIAAASISVVDEKTSVPS